MNNNPKISIIVPVYGVEKYIAKCIMSIKNQTFTDFECLIINDGTKDNSIEIALQTIKDDARFIIFNKENAGQGSARNLGIDNSRGEYIAFIDSDDWVEANYLKLMYEKIVEDDADICTCNVLYKDINNNIERKFKNNPKGYYENKDYLMANWYISNFMWDKLFKKSIFYKIRFDTTLKTNEDVFILFELLYGKKIVAVSEFLYNYLQRKEATSKGAPVTFIDDRIKIKNKQIEFAKKLGNIIKDLDYIKIVYLKHFILVSSITLARYSNNYQKDIYRLKEEIDYDIFNFKNILFMIKKDKKVGLSLLLFKISPNIFRIFIKFWFRNKSA